MQSCGWLAGRTSRNPTGVLPALSRWGLSWARAVEEENEGKEVGVKEEVRWGRRPQGAEAKGGVSSGF